MKARFNFREYEYSLPLITGLIVFAVLNLNGLEVTLGVFSSGAQGYRTAMLYGFLSNTGIFYLVAGWLVPRFLKKRHYLTFSLWLSLIFTLFTASETLIDILLLKQSYPYPDELVYESAEYNVISHLFVIVAAVIFRFSKDWFVNERLQRQLREEKLSAELSFLKSQVNPHFLFNTLNNLFSSAQKNGDEETADGISKLANLMRYMLHISDQTQISLDEEIEYLKSYIELQTMRWRNSNRLLLSASFPETPTALHIKPMILIPFIENAFKYGVSNHQDSRITISIEIFYGSVIFHCSNDIVNNNQMEDSGIGLTNVKRRLELLYKDNYELHIERDKDQFTVRLNLN